MALLRQIATNNNEEKVLINHHLSDHKTIIGRDLTCQVILDSGTYTMVSRRHTLLRPQINNDNIPTGKWEIADMNSANGTYVNNKRIKETQVLNWGDRIMLGANGPVFVLENPAPKNKTEMLTITQLFPIISTGQQLADKGYLYPGVFTVIFVVMMFLTVGKAELFNILLAIYIASIAFYFVYRLCGKYKHWWIIAGTMMITTVFLISPLLDIFIIFFRFILPGDINADLSNSNFFDIFIRMFFGAGLMEELIKALPVLIAVILGIYLRSPLREIMGVREPLDGILLGTASAVSFTLMETLGQYVPNMINYTSDANSMVAGQLVGLQLLIPRILGAVAGHLAYSGYFGYFIGLSVLRPRQRWLILAVGYLTASLLHALWNTAGLFSVFLLALVGVISYAFLVAAILKARAISPTREENFATRMSSR
jgi:RsiW-degrading membrane proteinase PrsW (M82 family)